jgi:ubiquinone/menaquinone biosynthesis C-methylase UbiE
VEWNPKDKAIRLADMGCGSGKILRIISAIALKQKRKVELIGEDANPSNANHNKKFTADAYKNTLAFFRERLR